MRRGTGFALVIVLATALSVSACGAGTRPPAAVTQIVSTTSFGMCIGYCATRLEISEGQAILVRDAHGGRGNQDLPAQRITAALSPSEWQEVARLAAATKLDGLPPIIGCPDCADGGAESLTITTASETHDIRSFITK